MSAVRTLLLFDIDGTLLLRAAGAHRDALLAALHDVLGIADPAANNVPAAGRTDNEIARAIALRSGVSSQRFDESVDELRAASCAEYARRCPDDLSAHVAPGVGALLDELSARKDVGLSLVTGNLEPIARLKLERAGIGRHFPTGQGGFGSDHEDRSELPAIARARAGENGTPFARSRTLVIGDTPRDIACAHADGLRCVAVATGPYDAGELTGADALATGAGEVLGLIDGLSPATAR